MEKNRVDAFLSVAEYKKAEVGRELRALHGNFEASPAKAAAGQLSWVYGRWPYLGSRSAAMDRTLEHAASLRSEDPHEH